MITVPAIRERCAGIDVGKRGLVAAIAVGPVDKEAEIKTREFGTTVPALLQLRQWLVEEGCTSVAIESTASGTCNLGTLPPPNVRAIEHRPFPASRVLAVRRIGGLHHRYCGRQRRNPLPRDILIRSALASPPPVMRQIHHFRVFMTLHRFQQRDRWQTWSTTARAGDVSTCNRGAIDF